MPAFPSTAQNFNDPYTPLPAFEDGTGGDGFIWSVPGSGTFDLTTSAQSVQDLINSLSGGQNGWTCGRATALMVQWVSDTIALQFQYGAAGQAFIVEDAFKGPSGQGYPWFIARTRAQLDNLYMYVSAGTMRLAFQFFVGPANWPL